MRTFIASLAAAAVQAGKYETVYSHYMQNHMGGAKTGLSPIEIDLNGTKTTKYVLSDGCTGEGADLSCPMGSRGYIVNSPDWDPAQPDFWEVDLVGDSYGTYLEWDVDLSQHGSGCINSFYTVSMPAYNKQGDLAPSSDGRFYCDANGVGGNFCPELDLMEANKWAF